MDSNKKHGFSMIGVTSFLLFGLFKFSLFLFIPFLCIVFVESFTIILVFVVIPYSGSLLYDKARRKNHEQHINTRSAMMLSISIHFVARFLIRDISLWVGICQPDRQRTPRATNHDAKRPFGPRFPEKIF